MQPPLIIRPLREQMELLSKQSLSRVESQPVVSASAQKIVDEYASLIRIWQEQATHVQRLRLFTIDELIRLTNLSGRFRVHASHRYTGEALRRCGFEKNETGLQLVETNAIGYGALNDKGDTRNPT